MSVLNQNKGEKCVSKKVISHDAANRASDAKALCLKGYVVLKIARSCT